MKVTGSILVAVCLLTLAPDFAWSDGIIYKIVVRHDARSEPLVIGDDRIVEQFSVYSGPNNTSRDEDGNWQADYTGAFIDFEAGLAHFRPAGLKQYDVEFHLMRDRSGGYWDEFYNVKYVMNPSSSRGFFYLHVPGHVRTQGNYIYHGVEGNWLYSSALWEELVRPLIQTWAEAAD